MTLREKRVRFTRMQAALVRFVEDNMPGYELALKYGYRCVDCPTGKKNSLHKKGLAADFDLYINGEWQKKTIAHKPIHQEWSRMGGDPMLPKDGNHYAFSGKYYNPTIHQD